MSKFTKLKSKLKTIPSVKQFLKSLGPIGRLKLTSLSLSILFLTAAAVTPSLLEPLEAPISLPLFIFFIFGAYFLGVTIGLAGANEVNKEKDNANNSNR